VILLDTSVLSAVLRRRQRGEREQALADRLGALLESDEPIAVPGIVLQELLSGMADSRQYDRVLRAVRGSFQVFLAAEGDHLKAADLVSVAARKGLALSTPDALIAAQTMNLRASLFSSDDDFDELADIAGLKLVSPN
jgi:predicted nucleic acid-binding protein